MPTPAAIPGVPASPLPAPPPTPTPSVVTLVTPPPAVPLPPTPTATVPPASYVAYTRHAVVGHGSDRIVHPVVVRLAWIGGIALLGWLFYGGVRIGQATMPFAPVVTTPASSVTLPASQPVVVAPVVVTSPAAPVIRVEIPPSPSPTPSSPASRELTDAERRNEALKERLRRRYGIE